MFVVKDKFVLVPAMKAYGVAELHLRSLLTTVVDGVSDKLHVLAALILDNNPLPHTHFARGMGHRVGMSTLNKKSSRWI
jgi:hypothetical protein